VPADLDSVTISLHGMDEEHGGVQHILPTCRLTITWRLLAEEWRYDGEVHGNTELPASASATHVIHEPPRPKAAELAVRAR
jgi:hypothetical protein